MRKFLTTTLKPLLPASWKWVATERNVDVTDATTVQWKQNTIEPLPEAPNSFLGVTGVLTVSTPHTDIDAAENALDDAVLELVHDIQRVQGIVFRDARKVALSETGPLGYDLTLTVITKKKEA